MDAGRRLHRRGAARPRGRRRRTPRVRGQDPRALRAVPALRPADVDRRRGSSRTAPATPAAPLPPGRSSRRRRACRPVPAPEVNRAVEGAGAVRLDLDAFRSCGRQQGRELARIAGARARRRGEHDVADARRERRQHGGRVLVGEHAEQQVDRAVEPGEEVGEDARRLRGCGRRRAAGAAAVREVDRLEPAGPAAGGGAGRDRLARRDGRSRRRPGPRRRAPRARGCAPGARRGGPAGGRSSGPGSRGGPAGRSQPRLATDSIVTRSGAERRTAPSSGRGLAQGAAGLGLFDPGEGGPAAAQDPGLLAGDGGEGVAQVLAVLQADRGDQREERLGRCWWRRAGRPSPPRRPRGRPPPRRTSGRRRRSAPRSRSAARRSRARRSRRLRRDLDRIDPAELAELVEDAWRVQAPKRTVAVTTTARP